MANAIILRDGLAWYGLQPHIGCAEPAPSTADSKGRQVTMTQREAVYCRGCGRKVGVATKDYAVYCSEHCADMPPALVDEERDSLIERMSRSGKTPVQLAVHFELSRQRVHQILQERHASRS